LVTVASLIPFVITGLCASVTLVGLVSVEKWPSTPVVSDLAANRNTYETPALRIRTPL